MSIITQRKETKSNERERFEITGLLIADMPTEDGYVYTLETLRLIERQILTAKPKLTIQDMNCPDYNKKGIPRWQPLKNRTMAVILDANIVDGSLNLICESRSTREGKKLSGMRKQMPDEIEYIPVGYGHERDLEGFKEVYNYTLTYINVEINIK